MRPAADVEWVVGRYADSVYRLALLLFPSADQAARATASAFAALPLETLLHDAHVERQLIATLRLPRRVRPRQVGTLPRSFWHLPARARLLLGLSIGRSLGAEEIASLTGSPATEVRALLYDA